MRIQISTILFLILSIPAVANNPNIHTGALPDWLVDSHPDPNRQPSPEDISGGYYYELLDQQTNLIRNAEYTHTIKHIINATGVQDEAEVSVTFSPQFQQVVFHRIRILRDGAIIDRLQPSRIQVVQEETDAHEFQYNGLKRAFVTLIDVRKNDRIEVAWSIIGFNPVFGKKYASLHYFRRSTAICNYSWTIISSPDRPLNILSRNKAPEPTQLHLGNNLVYRWKDPVLKDDDDESDSPSWFNTLPFVCITEYKNWHEVVDWGLNTFNHYQFTLPPALLRKIAEWQKTSGNDKDRFANVATRFVQNDIRYLGLEIGVNTHKPHAPADVFNGRFGDCKDKALLLAVILQHEGIPAFATLINTSEGHNLPEFAPSPRVFDHTIVAIQRTGGQWLYIDPTISGQRGELGNLYIPNYGHTLVIRDGEDSLRTVPPAKINSYFIRENLDARFYDTSGFTVNTTYTGGAADKVRSMYEEQSRKDIEAGYIQYYSSWLTGIRQRRPLDYFDDSTKNELSVREYYDVPNLWTTDKDGKRSFDFAVKTIRDHFPEPPESQSNSPLSLTYPIQVHYTLHLTMPEEWDFGAGPLHIQNNAYKFDFTRDNSGKDIYLHYDLTTFSDHLEPAEIRQYKKDYKEIDDRTSFTLYKERSAIDAEPTLDQTPAQPITKRKSPPTHSTPCWPAVWLTFFSALLFTRVFLYLNSRTADTRFTPGSGYPIGGWTLILGLFISAGFILDAWQLFRSNYYSNDNWTAWSNAGGTGMQYLYLGQLAIQLNFIAGAAAITFWFLKRRDIFPRMFVWYAGIVLCGRLVLVGLFYGIHIPDTLTAYRADLPWAFIRSGVYAAIWVTFVLRSRQVKCTFLEPFR